MSCVSNHPLFLKDKKQTRRAGFLVLATVGTLLLLLEPLHAEEPDSLNGVPLVMDSGNLMLQGKTLKLWGIDTLAPDQHCWHDQRPWRCGEQATLSLKHMVEDRFVHCTIKERPAADLPLVQCFTQSNKGEIDIAAYLVSKGWALASTSMVPSPYESLQDEARNNERGIWTSHFQTPDDWRNGVQHYLNDEEDRGLGSDDHE